MSSRYISRRYGESRPSSRASMARSIQDGGSSRPSSRMTSDSRPPSRGASISRGASPTPSYYNNYQNNGYGSGTSSPVNSRPTTPVFNHSTSRRLRERSIPPPAPLPQKIETLRPPLPSGKPPPGPAHTARVVASDFYRGKVKSIYEREPLFKDFCTTIPQRYGYVNIYNSDTLGNIKTDFKNMVEDKWNRMRCQDPSVEMNFGAKVYPWRDLATKPHEPASSRIIREQSRGPRATTPVNMPRVYVYHRSTMSPGPR